LTQKNENNMKTEYLPTMIKTRMQFATCIKVNKSYTCNAADGNRGKKQNLERPAKSVDYGL
jgi:hypothetical protein